MITTTTPSVEGRSIADHKGMMVMIRNSDKCHGIAGNQCSTLAKDVAQPLAMELDIKVSRLAAVSCEKIG